jgi:menaquinone-specific isochorismate synthase
MLHSQDMSRDSLIGAPATGPSNGTLAGAVRTRLRSKAHAAMRNGSGSHGGLVRIALPIDPMDPLVWLAAQADGFKFYWHGRDEDCAWAVAGVAEVIEGADAFERLERRFADPAIDREIRYVGGAQFQAEVGGDDRWRTFGSARFVLPRYELRVNGREAHLVLNLVLPDDQLADLQELVDRISSSHGLATALPFPVGREDTPTAEEWQRIASEALGDIERGDLDKIVLARRASFRFDDPLDPLVLMRQLQEAAPDSFHFLLQPQEGSALVGASPERLLRWDQGQIETEAVAGSRPRGRRGDRDASLRDELASSGKDGLEHRYVVDHLREALQGFCERVAEWPTDLMKLASKWHLRTPFQGDSLPGRTPLDLLAKLHPTPAVGGTPRDVALRRIQALEPFERGWYAGPIGWIGRDSADFAVAIRSGLIRQQAQGATLDLFSGAGIVAGSDPAAEWDEIENKIIDFTRVLGLED